MFFYGNTKDDIRLVLITARTYAKVWFHEVNKSTGADVGGVQCLSKEAFEAEFHPIVGNVRDTRKAEERWDGLL